MRKLKIVMMVILYLVFVMPVSAEVRLQARLDGDAVVVGWTPVVADTCVLTVYRDNWPVSVTEVNGASGAACVQVGNVAGRYTVRLNMDGACLTADVDVEAPRPTDVPTPASTEKPTAVPTMIPAEVSTETPTIIPTVAPTRAPTAAPAAAPVSIGSGRSDLADQVIVQVNAERARYGLSALTKSEELTRAAGVRAQELVRSFSHTRPDGTKWSTVSGTAYGENIAKGQATADKVMAAWMSSEGHRANILRESYGSIGVFAYVSNGVVYWAQLFGK